MMIYKMSFDMNSLDNNLRADEKYIFAESNNLGDIEYPNIKKGFFNTIIYKDLIIHEWPKVEFYYNSSVSDHESDLLLNSGRWPLIHERVKRSFEENDIKGIKYYAVTLKDNDSNKKNNDNYYLMYIENFIDAFDMVRSEYIYNEKYNLYTFVPMKTFLNYNNCSPYDVFRADKSPASIFVSERIRQIIIKNEFTGFCFQNQY